MLGVAETVPETARPNFESMSDQKLLDWIFGRAKELGILFGPNLKRLVASGKRMGSERPLHKNICEGSPGCKSVQCPDQACPNSVYEVIGDTSSDHEEIRVHMGGLEAREDRWRDNIGYGEQQDVYSRVENAVSVVAHEAAHTRDIENTDPDGDHPQATAEGRAAVARFREIYGR